MNASPVTHILGCPNHKTQQPEKVSKPKVHKVSDGNWSFVEEEKLESDGSSIQAKSLNSSNRVSEPTQFATTKSETTSRTIGRVGSFQMLSSAQ